MKVYGCIIQHECLQGIVQTWSVPGKNAKREFFQEKICSMCIGENHAKIILSGDGGQTACEKMSHTGIFQGTLCYGRVRAKVRDNCPIWG